MTLNLDVWRVLALADATADATVAVAIATGVLAVGTFVLALITYFGNRGARSAEARQLAAAHRQLGASYRPVIVPFQQSAEGVKFRGGLIPAGGGPRIEENPTDRSDLPPYSAAFLPVRNVGVGPALNVRGTFKGPHASGAARFPTEAIEAGALGVVAFENRNGTSLGYSGNDSSVAAVVEYDDVGGRTYRTNVTFDIGQNAYRSDIED